MARDRVGRDDIGGDHSPSLERGGARGGGAWACQRDGDRRSRRLIGFRHKANAELGNDPILETYLPELALKIVGRVLRPYALDEIHGLDHHPIARVHVGSVEQLEIGHEAARSDTEHEAAFAHVIELRGLGGDDRGMMIRQVDDCGAERDVFGAREESREEHHRRGNRFGGGGKMFAQPQLVEAERIGEHRLFTVLLERAPERAARRMDRHHEHSQAHVVLPARDRNTMAGLGSRENGSSGQLGRGQVRSGWVLSENEP
jgi:hypothetical protein